MDNTKKLGRKQRRIQTKINKKLKKRNYFGNAENIEDLVKQKKKEKLQRAKDRQKQRKPESGATKRKRKKEKLKENKKELILKDGGQDEQTIHKLEKLMYIKGKKKLPQSFANDGLDFILDVVNQTEDNNSSEANDISLSGSDDDFFSENEQKCSNVEAEKSSISNVSAPKQILSNAPKPNVDNEKKLPSNDNFQSFKEFPDVKIYSTVIDENKEKKIANQKTASESTKYVPPALRNTISTNLSEKKKRLKRQIKGHLNRVSESNLNLICSEIQSLYQENSRAMMTEILTELILIQFDTTDPIPERLITESVMIITVLSHNVGPEVVAHFTETACKKTNILLKTLGYGLGKAINNFIQLICSLYQLKAIRSKIVMDLISIFIDSFTEKDIELLVLILKNIGFQLRKDDPVLLKSIIESITIKAQDVQASDASRTKYMLDILTAIKNNNVRKLTGYDVDLIMNRRKKVKSICKGESDPFPNVSFEDMINADSNSRWWIVGSHWKGMPMLDKSKEFNAAEDNVSLQLVKAAKKLKMNTDIRKKIFYAVMSSGDYLDAFDSIFRIGLKGKQLREIAHVLVECCQQEKTYNPFYFHLLNKLCHYERDFVMTVQCSFWDRIKQLKSMSSGKIKNIIVLLSELFLSEALPLSLLKTIEYAEMDQVIVSFLRQVFVYIATNIESDKHIKSIFSNLSGQSNSLTRQGLKLFLQHFILHDEKFIKEHIHFEEKFITMNKNLLAKKCI